MSPSHSANMTLDARGVRTTCPSCGTTNRLVYASLGKPVRCARCKTLLKPPDAALEVNEVPTFDQLIANSAQPVVVDFWAPWCAPCRMMAPELDKFAQSRAGQALVVKVNTDALAELGERFRIRSIPTLAVFRHGREATRVSGVRSASDVDALVFGEHRARA